MDFLSTRGHFLCTPHPRPLSCVQVLASLDVCLFGSQAELPSAPFWAEFRTSLEVLDGQIPFFIFTRNKFVCFLSVVMEFDLTS